MDPLILSRIQFATNISFHILFPTISIALGWVLLFFKLRYRSTGENRWMEAYQYWVKVFALTFAMGVVSGITMSFQFGTNWPGFMEKVGNVAGPLLAYEVLTAFFTIERMRRQRCLSPRIKLGCMNVRLLVLVPPGDDLSTRRKPHLD